MIIDSHVHIGIFEDIDRVVNMSKEIVLESMNLYHIDFALVSNAAVEYDCDWKPVPMEKQKRQDHDPRDDQQGISDPMQNIPHHGSDLSIFF